MNKQSGYITTKDLWVRLFKSSSVDEYIQNIDSSSAMPAFSNYITELCKERNVKPERIIKRSEIESSFGHRLFSGARNPSRDTALQLAFGFELSIDETQQFLKIARVSALHPRIKRDGIIAYCLYHHKSLLETQDILYDNNLPLIGGKHNDK